jgi:hypothetical protein
VTSRSIAVGGLGLIAAIGAMAAGGAIGLAIGFGGASVVRMVTGVAWTDDRDRTPRWIETVGAGCVIGLAALAVAWAVAPWVGARAGTSVEWSTVPMVRGSLTQAGTIGLVWSAAAIATELVTRRAVVDAIIAWGRARRWRLVVPTAIVIAAALEAAVAPMGGDRRGVAVMSVGFGLVYVGARGRIAVPIAARITFELAAIALQGIGWIG